MLTRIASALIALSAVLTIAATPGQHLRTETGRLSLEFCLQQTHRNVPDCETYAAEAQAYADYTGSDPITR